MQVQLFHKNVVVDTSSGSGVDHATALLREVFGYSSLRPHQIEVLEQFLTGRDTLAVLPTGGGKSMCYVLPALMGEGLGVVISPLIALIRDQVIKYRKVGVPAAAIDSHQTPEQKWQVMDALRSGRVKLLFVSPERFALPRFREFLKSLSLRFVAVDEAHCVSQWGANFRPEYRKIGEYLDEFAPGLPRLALTATATKRVREDILDFLALRDPAKILKTPMRENLRIGVDKESNVEACEISMIDKVYRLDGQGIIYAGTRKKVESLTSKLRQAGIEALSYHAGLSARVREQGLSSFISGQAKVVVATNAFGLGIDKNDIRFVHHYGLPGSLENYVQEIGRAGRDGLPAECDMVYTSRDYHVQKFVIDKSHPPVSSIVKCYESLSDFFDEQSDVSRDELVEYVGASSKIDAGELTASVDTLIKEGFAARVRSGEFSSFQEDFKLAPGDSTNWTAFLKDYPLRKRLALERLDSMVVYAGAGKHRDQVLQRYFVD